MSFSGQRVNRFPIVYRRKLLSGIWQPLNTRPIQNAQRQFADAALTIKIDRFIGPFRNCPLMIFCHSATNTAFSVNRVSHQRQSKDCKKNTTHNFSLPHRRNDESLIANIAVRPALGHGLDLGPEFDAFGPVLIGVAKSRALPAAKRVIGDRHWDWHIDTNHADIHLRRKFPRRAAIRSKERDPVTVLMVGGIRSSFFKRFSAHDL